MSAAGDKTLKVWDLESEDSLCTFVVYPDFGWSVAVTPNGKRAVSASVDNTLNVWDLDFGLPAAWRPIFQPIATFHCDAKIERCVWAGDRTIIAGDRVGHLHFLRLEEKVGDATEPSLGPRHAPIVQVEDHLAGNGFLARLLGKLRWRW